MAHGGSDCIMGCFTEIWNTLSYLFDTGLIAQCWASFSYLTNLLLIIMLKICTLPLILNTDYNITKPKLHSCICLPQQLVQPKSCASILRNKSHYNQWVSVDRLAILVLWPVALARVFFRSGQAVGELFF